MARRAGLVRNQRYFGRDESAFTCKDDRGRAVALATPQQMTSPTDESETMRTKAVAAGTFPGNREQKPLFCHEQRSRTAA